MHKIDQTVLDAIGIYEASCEAAGAPLSEGARIHAVQMALQANGISHEDLIARLIKSFRLNVFPRGEAEAVVDPELTKPARKPRAAKGAK